MTPLPFVMSCSVLISESLHERFYLFLKDRTNGINFISSSSVFGIMAYIIFFVYWLSMLLIVLPGSKLTRRRKPEWQELNEFRRYLRSDEFRKKQKALEVEMFKEVIKHG